MGVGGGYVLCCENDVKHCLTSRETWIFTCCRSMEWMVNIDSSCGAFSQPRGM